MKEIIKKITAYIDKLPKIVKVILMFLPIIVIIATFYFVTFKPKTEEIKKLRAEISRQENEIAKKETLIAKLPILKVKYEEAKKHYHFLKLQLPEEKEISNLLRQVSDLGIQAGLQILLWKPQPRKEHPSGIVFETPVNVNMSGTYHKLGAFFSNLTNLGRIVNIKNITLSQPKPMETEAVLNISFSAATFTAKQEVITKPE